MKSANLINKSLSIIVLLLLTATVVFSHDVKEKKHAVNKPETQEPNLVAIENLINEELQQSNTPGAAIGIVRGDRVIYAKGFGVANIETGLQVTPETLFRLGSTTKMFTGAALVTLSSQGKLRLDEPVSNHVAGIHPSLAQLTVHQLLSQTAGFADFQAPFISNDDEALSRMARGWKEDVLFAKPGETYSYSSPGYWFAGYIIEEVSKKPYATAMAELLFAPLGMKRTTLRPLEAMTYPLAMGHDVKKDSKPEVVRPAFNNVAMWPAGSIYSNVNELSRFVIALLNEGKLDGKQALSPEVAVKLFGRYAKMPGDPQTSYGYGLLNFEQRGIRIVMHGGFSRGYGSMIQMFPDQDFALIVQTNRSGQTLPRSRNKIIETFLQLKPETTAEPKKQLESNQKERTNFEGTYVNGTQLWKIVVKADKLFYKTSEGEFELTRTGPFVLSFGDKLDNDLVFVPNASGDIEFLFDGLYSAKKQSNR